MVPLFLILHIVIGATLAGSAMIVALTLGFDTLRALLTAALIGVLAALPVSWLVAKKIGGQ